MSEKEILQELIMKALDGTCSPTEKSELEAAFTANRESKDMFEQEAVITNLLESDAAVNYDIDIKDIVLNKIGINKSNNKSAKFSQFWELFSAGYFRYGFAASCGIAATILFFLIFKVNIDSTATNITGDEIIGMMANDESYQGLKAGDAINIDVPEIKANAQALYFKNLALVNLSISSGGMTMLEIDYDVNNIILQGIKPISTNPSGNISVASNLIQINTIDVNKYQILFKNVSNLPDMINIRIYSKAHLIGTYRLTIDKI
ncbi:MAG: hypothetical protein QG635_331 [Bacteroidota bacterium]|nr:hypothetical protein [Bacteroidota bacterium]